MLSAVILVVSVVMVTVGKADMESPRVLGVIGCAQRCRSMCLCSMFTYHLQNNTCTIEIQTTGITIPEANRTCSCNDKNQRCIKTRKNNLVSTFINTL